MEKEVDLRQRIMKMYEDNYHGGVMKLVVIGGGNTLPFPCMCWDIWLMSSLILLYASVDECLNAYWWCFNDQI